MRLTVSNIFTAVAASVNQSATAPTAGGAEHNLWLEYINHAVREWSAAADWEDLRKNYYPSITSLTQASVGLPQDFRELAAPPRHYGTGIDGGEEWPIIVPEEIGLYNVETDKYIYVFGDISNGFSLQWNPGTLASGASLSIPYFSYPTSLASPAQVPVVSDSQYLIDRVTAFVWEGRSDPRFQQAEAKAREKLLLMVEANSMNKYSGHAGIVYTKNTLSKQGFRVGRD